MSDNQLGLKEDGIYHIKIFSVDIDKYSGTLNVKFNILDCDEPNACLEFSEILTQ